MRVLVTGASGFVGRAVARQLSRAGHDIVVLLRQPGQLWLGPVAAAKVYGDVRDAEAMRRAVDSVDAVCHLAALTRVRESLSDPETYQAVNTGGTQTLLDALLKRRNSGGDAVPFVHACTAVVYGAPADQPISEACPIDPRNPYAASKAAADAAIQRSAEAGAIAAVSLRMFNIAGATGRRGDLDETRIIPKTLTVAAGRHPELTVNGDGSAVRDYVHVIDVAEAFVLALAAATPGRFRAYNIGATPATVAQIIEAARKTTGRAIPVRHLPAQPEAPELTADTRRVRAELGWEPQWSSLPQILADAWEAVIS